MKRTTLALDEVVIKRLKARAAAEGRTIQAVANDLLAAGLARRDRVSSYKLSLKGFAAKVRPGVDLLDRDRLLDTLDDER